MSKSFVTEQKELVERGENENCGEKFEARAEQLRVKKYASDAARAHARQSLLEKRKKEQEAEESRQRKLAEAAENTRKGREVKAMHALMEMERKVAAERVQNNQLKLSEICREIYIDLAMAAWDGGREVCVRGDISELDGDLLRLGIETRRPQELATSLTCAIQDLLSGMEGLAQAVVGIDYRGASRGLSKASICLREAGHTGLSTPLTELVRPLQAQITANWRSLEQRRVQAVAAIKSFNGKISELNEVISPMRELKVEKETAHKKREAEFADAVNEIREHLDEIATSSAIHPYGAAPVLRQALLKFVPHKDFSKFSDTDIINLVRYTGGNQPLDLETDSPQQWEIEEDTRSPNSLTQLLDSRKRLERKVSKIRKEVSCIRDELKAVKLFQKKAKACRSAAEKFTKILECKFENVESKHLKFMDGKYVGPTYARLAESCPDESTGICDAYRELNWLCGESGKDFCGYLDIALSELAKERSNSVILTFFDSDDGCKIGVGKDSLDCNIGHPLLSLLLSKRGFGVKVSRQSVLPVSMKLSW
jgi:hypothetical protein